MVQLAKADPTPDTSPVEEAFNRAAAYIHNRQGFDTEMLHDKAIGDLIRETTSLLCAAVSYGIGDGKPSQELHRGLKESAFVFSGFKAFHEMNEAAGLLTDDKGNVKDFRQFSQDVKKINADYNQHHLHAEYAYTIAAAQMATRWEELAADGDDYDLQYRTAGDGAVRTEHAALEGITLPPSDPFWSKYYPPNGWGCRCTVVRVRKGKYATSNRSEAMAAGECATAGKYAEMFRFNSGKSRSVFNAWNPYTIPSCNGCDKNGLKLARTDNQLCAACAVIQRMKCAGKDAREWARVHVDEKKGLDVIGANFATGSISIRRSTAKDIIGHTRDLRVIEAIPEVLQNAQEWRYIGWGEIKKDPGTGKRKHPEAEYFLYYETEIAGKKRYVNVKAHSGYYREVPYCILDQCNTKMLKKGMPHDVDKYKKK